MERIPNGRKKSVSQLSASMTLRQFDNGYWYAIELKEFSEKIGIPFASKLRKDELEKAIKTFLQTGAIESPARRDLTNAGIRDVDRGLSLELPVALYTNDRETKSFLEREAQRLAPGAKRKSGARYRLNRWREEQLAQGVRLTYGGLVKEYVRLNLTREPFRQIPTGRYINFLSDFLAAEKGASREQALKAWSQLKTMDTPKNYRSWRRSLSRRNKPT
jgi:hypothetical protein